MDPAMRSAFGLKGKADDKTIQKQLILKKISYGSLNGALVPDQDKDKAIPHNSKCRYGERGAGRYFLLSFSFLCIFPLADTM